MTKVLATGVAGAIGSHYLPAKNQLLFVEYGGFISKIDRVASGASIVSQGTVTLKGTFSLDCETGVVATTATSDIFWRQQTNIERQMEPLGTAQIVNLGVVDFNAVTPSTLPTYAYSTTPINGDNNATNKLVAGDVFCVKTREGNYAKLQVVTYGYDIVLKWVTYKLNATYTRIGSGYTELEDIAITANESTAYVTERGGNLLSCSLSAANRATALLVVGGMTAPHQIFLDEVHNRAYVIELATSGNLWRIDLVAKTKTSVATGFKSAVGLVLDKDLLHAYISEQGTSSIVRLNLQTGERVTIATGLTQPFMLSWADASETRLLVPERGAASRVRLVDVTRTTGNVTTFISGTPVSPSSVAPITNSSNFAVFCNDQVLEYDLALSIPAGGFFYKGIGYVPHDRIISGLANTTGLAGYPWQFNNNPFGGTLPVMIDHRRAHEAGRRFYRVLVDGVPRQDTWNDLVMNPVNGRYEIIEAQTADANGFYQIHDPAKVYYNTDLGCLLNSLNLSNGLHQLRVEFYNTAGPSAVPVNVAETGANALLINNEACKAVLDMPTIQVAPGTVNAADPNCGYLKYTAGTNLVNCRWIASHPKGMATYSYSVIKGANGYFTESGALTTAAPVKVGNLGKTVTEMLGACPGVAAFAEYLYVATTVINGVSRQSQYDASASMAFCLAK
jgi:hypothetical protein